MITDKSYYRSQYTTHLLSWNDFDLCEIQVYRILSMGRGRCREQMILQSGKKEVMRAGMKIESAVVYWQVPACHAGDLEMIPSG